MKESKYLMEFTTRKEIVFKVFTNCIIFVQVSESCPYGRHLQDMCKLALPLFFLVIRMNVGYSVVAEFIIQHEDMTSITEALTILHKRWD